MTVVGPLSWGWEKTTLPLILPMLKMACKAFLSEDEATKPGMNRTKDSQICINRSPLGNSQVTALTLDPFKDFWQKIGQGKKSNHAVYNLLFVTVLRNIVVA